MDTVCVGDTSSFLMELSCLMTHPKVRMIKETHWYLLNCFLKTTMEMLLHVRDESRHLIIFKKYDNGGEELGGLC